MVDKHVFWRKGVRGAVVISVIIVLTVLGGCSGPFAADSGGSSGRTDTDDGGSPDDGSTEFSITALACEKRDIPGLGDRWEVTFSWDNLPAGASYLFVTQSSTAILNLTSPQDVIVTSVASEPQDVTITVQVMPGAMAEATDAISCPTTD